VHTSRAAVRALAHIVLSVESVGLIESLMDLLTCGNSVVVSEVRTCPALSSSQVAYRLRNCVDSLCPRVPHAQGFCSRWRCDEQACQWPAAQCHRAACRQCWSSKTSCGGTQTSRRRMLPRCRRCRCRTCRLMRRQRRSSGFVPRWRCRGCLMQKGQNQCAVCHQQAIILSPEC
jgi:hypothetical protein